MTEREKLIGTLEKFPTFGDSTLGDRWMPEAVERLAEHLYNAGYRKQSEGDWIARDCITESKRGRTIHYSTQKCSACGKWNGRHKSKFCPNCGAKMKGR